ncbi:hypothetical protein CSKR_109390, partial [Clonorchis sinensis]
RLRTDTCCREDNGPCGGVGTELCGYLEGFMSPNSEELDFNMEFNRPIAIHWAFLRPVLVLLSMPPTDTRIGWNQQPMRLLSFVST